MKRWIAGRPIRLLAALALLLRLAAPGLAADNYLVKDGAGNPLTIKSKDAGAGVQVPQSVPSDATGTPYTSGNPLPVQLQAGGALQAATLYVGTTQGLSAGISGLLAVGGNAASGASDTGNPLKIGGVFNTAQPTVTTGQRVDAQMTARGAQIVATGADTFSVTCTSGCTATSSQLASGDGLAATTLIAVGGVVYNGSGWDRMREATGDGLGVTGIPETAQGLWNGTGFDRQVSAKGTIGVAAIDSESSKTTYSASASFTSAASATDLVVIQGSGTKTIRIKRITVAVSQGTPALAQIAVIRRSTANSGGTAVTDTNAKHDTNNAAATAVVTHYTANAASLGTGVATLHNFALTSGSGTTPISIGNLDLSSRNDQSFVLRGTSDFITLNNATGASSGSVIFTIEWTEE